MFELKSSTKLEKKNKAMTSSSENFRLSNCVDKDVWYFLNVFFVIISNVMNLVLS